MLTYPQVALDFMNHDHAEFIELREQLLTALSSEANTTETETLAKQLLEHTRIHFAEEERQMQEAQFPPYPMHKGEHDRVLADMEARVAQWQQDHDAKALHDWLETAVAEWFVSHVNTMDFITARFIVATRE